jgi:prepilin-type N-terminal cleavage/methylation domain-containing protein
MKFTCKANRIEKKTAAPAVCRLRGGFTMLELMVVIVIIGILASLAYSSLIDMVFTNRAKETAQAMRTFVERAMVEGKMRGVDVTLELNGNDMRYQISGETKLVLQPLSSGFEGNKAPAPNCATVGQNLQNFNTSKPVSKHIIGLSGITEEGCFIACGAREYCGAIVKQKDKNSFQAFIKKGSNASWSAI